MIEGEAMDDLKRLHDVPVELAVEIGRTTMTIRETLELAPGAIVSLNRLAGEPVDLLDNGRPLARGEVVVIDEEFGLRITEILDRRAEQNGPPVPVEHAMVPHPAPIEDLAGLTVEELGPQAFGDPVDPM
jgi:flagellar motor switch protein FliN/FliY